MQTFRDKIVWITGGGSGLGRAMALEFARQGASVVVSGRRIEALDDTVDAITSAGGRGHAIVCDVTDESANEAAVAEIIDRYGKLDVAVANAGMGVVGRFEDLSDAEWRQQMGVNLFGAANTARHALPRLRETRGRMVFIGSVSGLICLPNSAAYSASKFAIRAISLTLSQELKTAGVSSTVIHPGFVESDISKVDNQGHFDASRPDNRPSALMWSGERAARVMVKAIAKRRREFVFTGHGRLGAFLGMHFPGVVDVLGARVAGRIADNMAKGK